MTEHTWWLIYRLMHVLFHIKTVIIPRDRYRPEGQYQSKDDNSPDMEKGMHQSIYHIFQHWIKKNKINFTHTHTHTQLWVIAIGWGMITILIWKKACIVLFIKRLWYFVLFIKRLDIMLSEFCPDICPWADIAVGLQCLRMGKIDVITYKYVII